MPPGFNQHPGQDRGPRAGATLRDLKKDSTVFRLFKFIFKNYKVNFVVVTLCIIVMDDGRVNGFDTHENLLRTNGIYQELYEMQTSGGSGDFDQPTQ